jgi:hypothetical protein
VPSVCNFGRFLGCLVRESVFASILGSKMELKLMIWGVADVPEVW